MLFLSLSLKWNMIACIISQHQNFSGLLAKYFLVTSISDQYEMVVVGYESLKDPGSFHLEAPFLLALIVFSLQLRNGKSKNGGELHGRFWRPVLVVVCLTSAWTPCLRIQLLDPTWLHVLPGNIAQPVGPEETKTGFGGPMTDSVLMRKHFELLITNFINK